MGTSQTLLLLMYQNESWALTNFSTRTMEVYALYILTNYAAGSSEKMPKIRNAEEGETILFADDWSQESNSNSLENTDAKNLCGIFTALSKIGSSVEPIQINQAPVKIHLISICLSSPTCPFSQFQL